MRLEYLPVIIFLALPITLTVTFSLAIYYKHVTYVLPYISDSGAFPPESCIFGQVLNIVSVLMAFAMYVRFRQVREIFTRHEFSYKNHRLNQRSIIIGWLASAGISLVANFPELDLLPVHWFGAVLAFGFGSIYQCVQTALYYKMYPIVGTIKTNRFRLVLSVVSVCSFVVFLSTGLVANQQYRGSDVTKWKREDGGFELHVISTTTEWMCASGTMTYLLLFISDFKMISVNEPEVFVQDNFTVPVNVQLNNQRF